MRNQDHALHRQLLESAERARLAHDNLGASRYVYFESPTERNRQRLEAARREYLIAVEDRESLVERIAEAEAYEDDVW